MTESNKLPKPTTEQAKILKHTCKSKIVIAVPGAGKTTLLLQTIAHHFKKREGNCLMLAFSKKASTENQEKIKRYLSDHQTNITVKTFDAFCYSVVKGNWKLAGYTDKPKFKDEFERQLFAEAYATITQEESDSSLEDIAEKIVKTSIEKQISIKRAITDLEVETHKSFCDQLIQIKNEYLDMRVDDGATYFSEQVIQCKKILESYPKVLRKVARKYQLVLIDEIQDLTKTQLDIAMLLADKIDSSILVGDDAQSIYTFRGVDGKNFERLENSLGHSKTFSLSFSHRCPIPIALFASTIRNNIAGVTPISMQSNKEGFKPTLIKSKTPNAEYNFIAEQILKLTQHQFKFSDIVIIARKHESLNQMQRILQKFNIDYKTKYDENPLEHDTEKLFSIVTSLLRLFEYGFNEEDVLNVFSFLGSAANDGNLLYIQVELGRGNKKTPKETDNNILRSFGRLIRNFTNRKSLEAKLACITHFVLKDFESSNKYYHTSALSEIGRLSKKAKSIVEIIDDISKIKFDKEDAVSLLTAHASKGLEFKVVFVIDANCDLFPYIHSKKHHDNTNDELKLFYVAVTRCSQFLYMCAVENKFSKPTEFVTKLKGRTKLIQTTTVR